MPLDVPVKLQRVLQERVIAQLGSNDAIPLDVQFIATSKTDLVSEVANGTFRDDLYWHLNVAVVRVPPLSARQEDIPCCSSNRCARRQRGTPPRTAPRRQRCRPIWPGATGRATCANCAVRQTCSSVGWTGCWRVSAPRCLGWQTACGL